MTKILDENERLHNKEVRSCFEKIIEISKQYLDVSFSENVDPAEYIVELEVIIQELIFLRR